MDLREFKSKVEQHFNCPECEGVGASLGEIASTGTGISRFFDMQNHEFLYVSCSNCGLTKFYNRVMLASSSTLTRVLDVITGL